MAEVPTLELERKALEVRALLGQALQRHGRLVYSNSLGAEAMVLSDIIWTHLPAIDMFSIDTGRLHEETYELLERLQRRYQRRLRVVYPDAAALERLVAGQGVNGFYQSLEARLECCRVRKVEPFRRAIAGFPAWITGVRREQSAGRAPARPWSGMPSTGCTRSARCSTGARRRCGSTSVPAACPTTRCTTASSRASAARRAPARSSRAKPAAPAAGGGNSPSHASAACIRGSQPPAAAAHH